MFVKNVSSSGMSCGAGIGVSGGSNVKKKKSSVMKKVKGIDRQKLARKTTCVTKKLDQWLF